MSNGWSPQERVLHGNTSLVASQSNIPVSQEFKVSAGGSCRMVLAINASECTGTVDLKLQTSSGGSTWADSKATTIAAAGRVYLRLAIEISADQTYLPLLAKCRLVATTGAGETITISSVEVLQPL